LIDVRVMESNTRMTRIVRPLRNGQITIPAEFRRRLGISEESLLRLTLEDGELRLKPVTTAERDSGSPWLRELFAMFELARREAGRYSEAEVNDAIDAAVKAVRAEHEAGRP
jgi:AbrB family looped-hinge helix DNA binding protein